MSETVDLGREALAGYIRGATHEVFTTMVALTPEPGEVLAEPLLAFHHAVSGMVGLAGTYTGVLSIHCSQELAAAITASMLGLAEDEVADDIEDAIGEIANMLGGYVKGICSTGGLDVSLSVPTVVAGEEYAVNAMKDKDCVGVPFTVGAQTFTVGLTIKREKGK